MAPAVAIIVAAEPDTAISFDDAEVLCTLPCCKPVALEACKYADAEEATRSLCTTGTEHEIATDGAPYVEAAADEAFPAAAVEGAFCDDVEIDCM